MIVSPEALRPGLGRSRYNLGVTPVTQLVKNIAHGYSQRSGRHVGRIANKGFTRRTLRSRVWYYRCNEQNAGKLHGGAHLRVFRLITAAAVLFLVSSAVRADGLDGRVNVNGGGPGSPPCGSLQFFADGNGDFGALSPADCTTTVNTTVITFAALDSQTNGGLSCLSQLTTIGWKETTSSANGVDSCTFTAPSKPDLFSFLGSFSDDDEENDCDLDDFAFGIAKGCDVKLTTSLPFVPGAVGDLSVNGAPILPFPEPASIGLLATGLAALFVRRRRSNNVGTEI